MKLETLKERLDRGELVSRLIPIYGSVRAELNDVQSRIADVVEQYESHFGKGDVALFTAPGRTELGGNHTDHQRGRVLAGAVSMDMVACAASNGSRWVRIVSDGYPEVAVNLDDLDRKSRERGTSAALVRGVAHALAERGYDLHGFSACVSSTIPGGAGLSSSAAYEILIGVILNHLSCAGVVSQVELAKIGQYAESQYFGKPCGLLDQMACSIGGVVSIDFENPNEPIIEAVDFSMDESGYVLCIVESGGHHADLTDEYASVPDEMREVAAFFDRKVLREVDEGTFWASLQALREQVGDRAVLRAIHFFGDNARVLEQVEALRAQCFDDYLAMVAQSGISSAVQLQNLYAVRSPQVQDVVVAISLAKHLLAGRGAVRVHGGGFAGTIQAYVPVDAAEEFTAGMNAVLGEGSCHRVRIRPVGGAEITV